MSGRVPTPAQEVYAGQYPRGAGAGAGVAARPTGAGPDDPPTCALDVLLRNAPGPLLDAALVFFLTFPFGDGKGHDKTWVAIEADDAFAAVVRAFHSNLGRLPDIVKRRVDSLLAGGVGKSPKDRAIALLAKCGSEEPTRREFTTLLGEIHNALGAQLFPPGVVRYGVGVEERGAVGDYARFDPPVDGAYTDPTLTSLQTHVTRISGRRGQLGIEIDQVPTNLNPLWNAIATRATVGADAPPIALEQAGGLSDPGSFLASETAMAKPGFRGRWARASNATYEFVWPLGIPIAWKTTMQLDHRGGGADGPSVVKKNLWLPGTSQESPADIRVELVGSGVEINVINGIQSVWSEISAFITSERDGNGSFQAQVGKVTIPVTVTRAGRRVTLDYTPPRAAGPALSIICDDEIGIRGRFGGTHPIVILLPLLKANGDQGTALGNADQTTPAELTLALQGGQGAGTSLRPTDLARSVVSGDVMSSLFGKGCGILTVGPTARGELTIGKPLSRTIPAGAPDPERLRTAVEGAEAAPGPNGYTADAAKFASVEQRSNAAGIYGTIRYLAGDVDHVRSIRKGSGGLTALHLYFIQESTLKPGITRIQRIRTYVNELRTQLVNAQRRLEIPANGGDPIATIYRETIELYTVYSGLLENLERELLNPREPILTRDPIPDEFKTRLRTLLNVARQTFGTSLSRDLVNDVGQRLLDEMVRAQMQTEDPAVPPSADMLQVAFRKATAKSLRYTAATNLVHNTLYTDPTSFVDTPARYTLAMRTYTNRASLLASLVDQDAMTRLQTVLGALPSSDAPLWSRPLNELQGGVNALFRRAPFYYDARTSEILANYVVAYTSPYTRRTSAPGGAAAAAVEVPESVAVGAEGLIPQGDLQSINKSVAGEDYWTALGVVVADDGTPTVETTPTAAGKHAEICRLLRKPETTPIGDATIIQDYFRYRTLLRIVETLFDAGPNAEVVVAEDGVSATAATVEEDDGAGDGAGDEDGAGAGDGAGMASMAVDTSASVPVSGFGTQSQGWSPDRPSRTPYRVSGAVASPGGMGGVGMFASPGPRAGAGAAEKGTADAIRGLQARWAGEETLGRRSPGSGGDDGSMGEDESVGAGAGAGSAVSRRRPREESVEGNVIEDAKELLSNLGDPSSGVAKRPRVEGARGSGEEEDAHPRATEIRSMIDRLEREGTEEATALKDTLSVYLGTGMGGRRRRTYRKHRTRNTRLTYKRRHS